MFTHENNTEAMAKNQQEMRLHIPMFEYYCIPKYIKGSRSFCITRAEAIYVFEMHLTKADYSRVTHSEHLERGRT